MPIVPLLTTTISFLSGFLSSITSQLHVSVSGWTLEKPKVFSVLCCRHGGSHEQTHLLIQVVRMDELGQTFLQESPQQGAAFLHLRGGEAVCAVQCHAGNEGIGAPHAAGAALPFPSSSGHFTAATEARPEVFPLSLKYSRCVYCKTLQLRFRKEREGKMELNCKGF